MKEDETSWKKHQCASKTFFIFSNRHLHLVQVSDVKRDVCLKTHTCSLRQEARRRTCFVFQRSSVSTPPTQFGLRPQNPCVQTQSDPPDCCRGSIRESGFEHTSVVLMNLRGKPHPHRKQDLARIELLTWWARLTFVAVNV